MKKHVKRTALPVPNYTTDIIPSLNQNHASIPHILIVALTERLLPILPHIDDYLCLICTSLAYKPIRLNCGRKKTPLFRLWLHLANCIIRSILRSVLGQDAKACAK